MVFVSSKDEKLNKEFDKEIKEMSSFLCGYILGILTMGVMIFGFWILPIII